MAIGYVAPGGNIAFHAAPRPEVTWPHQVGVVPRSAYSFQDRDVLARLEQVAADTAPAARRLVLVGTGGVGKTQLAARHARAAWADSAVDLLVWITAASRIGIVSAYAQAAAEVLHADATDPEHAAGVFLAWLEPKPGAARRWLIILDDLADPADLRGLWPPSSPHGRTLVTTRRRDAALTGGDRHTVEVGPFTPGEAVSYLTAVLDAHGRTEPDRELAGLAEDLGRLPLALAQAAVHLADTGMDCGTYRVRLADRARRLADMLPGYASLPDDQAVTVAAAWSLSVQRADELPPVGLAGPVLQLAAMLDPHGIPVAVLTGPPVLAYLGTRRARGRPAHVPRADRLTRRWRRPAATTAAEALGALRNLHRLSLLHYPPTEDTVRVHPLVQRVTRDVLSARELDRLGRVCAEAITAGWEAPGRDGTVTHTLSANIVALGAAVVGSQHPAILSVRGHLATLQGQQGDAAGAVAAYRRLLADRERVLGPEHTDTLEARNNLAHWQGMTGDVAGALAAYTDLLEHAQRILGPDHPGTLTTRNNLAHWQGHAGNPTAAAAAFAELLADRERVLGPDHPDTLATRGNLAHWTAAAG